MVSVLLVRFVLYLCSISMLFGSLRLALGAGGVHCSPCFFFFFLKEKLAPLQDLKHSTLCSKYSTGYFKKPHLVVAQTLIRRQAIDNRRPGNQSCAWMCFFLFYVRKSLRRYKT